MQEPSPRERLFGLYYDGPLGVTIGANETTFAVWAPSAKSMQVVLFDPTGPERCLEMEPGSSGEWMRVVPEDLTGAEYVYQVGGEPARRAVDPYARAVTANGERAVVVDVGKQLGAPRRLPSFGDPATAVIYEAHVRDMTIAPDNGITHKGKFLGLAEAGTRTKQGHLSGLDYITSLGITHVQLLPIFDFGSVDELGDLGFNTQYNWGYDPDNYNVPEGSYSTDPSDPLARLTQLRALVDACHARGIRVIMDVVYNHVYDAATNPLEILEPGYYFRKDHWGNFYDATVCGNETASERPMMRRFIVDSVRYWAETFGLDGFRFDLMGIHDVDTMNAVRAVLDDIDPGIILLGEGWAMGNHDEGAVGADQRAGHLMPRIAMFNDTFRDVVKGSNFQLEGAGFVSGNPHYATDDAPADTAAAADLLLDSMLGAPGTRNYHDAAQSVVYNESHDNYTMFDKLTGTASLIGAPEEEIARRHRLATSIQLLSHGLAFVHAGQELLRTKQGVENSYISPDSINAFDYDRAGTMAESVDFFRALVAFRRSQPWITETNYEVIKAKTTKVVAQGLHLSYRVADAFGPGRDAWVLANAEEGLWQSPILSGTYRVHLCDEQVVPEPSRVSLGEEFPVPALSVAVLERCAVAMDGR